MIISLIVAMDKQGLIGNKGGLPWHLSADLQHFKKMTMAKPIIMGRITYQSIGRPLPGRQNIIISSNPDYKVNGGEVFPSLQAAVSALTVPEVMIIGGASLYQQALPLCHQIYLTEVMASLEGDTWFPKWDKNDWQVCDSAEYPADKDNDYPYSFKRLTRIVTT